MGIYIPQNDSPNTYVPQTTEGFSDSLASLGSEFKTNVAYGAINDFISNKINDLSSATQKQLNTWMPDLVKKPVTLTPDDYKNSQYYREGINYKNSVPEAVAAHDANEFDAKQSLAEDEELMSQSKWMKATEGAVSLAGNIVNPGNLAVGVGAAVAILPLTGAAATATGVGLLSGVGGFVANNAVKAIGSGIVGGVYGFGEGVADQLNEIRKTQKDFDWRPVWKTAAQDAAMFSAFDTIALPLASKAAEVLGIKSAVKKMFGVQKAPISRANHDMAIDAVISQLDNDKIPDIKPIVQQGMNNQRSVLDESYLPHIEANRAILTDSLDKIDAELERMQSLPQTDELKDQFQFLKEDRDNLQRSLDNHDIVKNLIENPEQPVSEEDIGRYMKKMNSEEAENVTGAIPKDSVPTDMDIAPLDEDNKQFISNTNTEFNSKKDILSQESQAIANKKIDTADLDDEKQHHEEMQKCLQRNIGRF